MKRTQRGFTLIELLIVVAILGILGAILFVAIGGNPQRDARDARRIADINQLQLALELYKNQDANGAYPTSLGALVTQGFIGGVPKDPKTAADYKYAANPATNPTNYHLGAILENDKNKSLCSDADFDSTGWGAGVPFNGKDATGVADACGTGVSNFDNASSPIYDVKS